MTQMTMPGFTATAALSKTRSYRNNTSGGQPQSNSIISQLPNRNAPGKSGCILDCIDRGNSRNYCAKVYCRDRGNPDRSSDSSFNDFLSGAGITFWEGACNALTSSPYLCGSLANEMRRQS